MFVKVTLFDGEVFAVNVDHVVGFCGLSADDFDAGDPPDLVRNAETAIFLSDGDTLLVIETAEEVEEMFMAGGVDFVDFSVVDADAEADAVH